MKTTDNFYRQIISLIPSPDLKDAIAAHDHLFGEEELLKIIFENAPSFAKKLEMLDTAAELFADKQARAHARNTAAHQRRMFDAFMADDADHVYETEIRIRGQYEDEKYVAKSYADSLVIIKSYLSRYRFGADDLDGARFCICKKTAFPPKTPRDINDKVGTVGECLLDINLDILSLYMYRFGKEIPCPKDVDYCDLCKRRCIDGIMPHYPLFLNKYDLVAFYNDLPNDPSSVTYGFLGYGMDECDDDSYVIDLIDNKPVTERSINFEDEDSRYSIYYAHCHPSFCCIFRPDPTTVPRKALDAYEYAVGGLKKYD